MKIKVFAFQKDENDILEDWLSYHSYLFGKENIYLIDHNSKHSKSIIKDSGVNMINFSGPFAHNKGLQLTKAMNDNKNSCEIIGKSLQQVYKNKFDQKRDISRLTLSYKYFLYFLKSKLMQLKYYLFNRNQPEYLNQLNKKGLSKEAVKQRIKSLSKADKLGGKYQVDETYYGIYSIKKLT